MNALLASALLVFVPAVAGDPFDDKIEVFAQFPAMPLDHAASCPQPGQESAVCGKECKCVGKCNVTMAYCPSPNQALVSYKVMAICAPSPEYLQILPDHPGTWECPDQAYACPTTTTTSTTTTTTTTITTTTEPELVFRTEPPDQTTAPPPAGAPSTTTLPESTIIITTTTTPHRDCKWWPWALGVGAGAAIALSSLFFVKPPKYPDTTTPPPGSTPAPTPAPPGGSPCETAAPPTPAPPGGGPCETAAPPTPAPPGGGPCETAAPPSYNPYAPAQAKYSAQSKFASEDYELGKEFGSTHAVAIMCSLVVLLITASFAIAKFRRSRRARITAMRDGDERTRVPDVEEELLVSALD